MSLPHDIYSQRILELAANIPRMERLLRPDATASAHSKLCGSWVTIDVSMQDSVATDYGQSVKACLLGQTAAAVMGREIVGSTAAELRAVGSPNAEEPVRDYKARHASTLLVFDAVEDTIVQIEAKLSYRRSTVCSLQSVVYFPFSRSCGRTVGGHDEIRDSRHRLVSQT